MPGSNRRNSTKSGAKRNALRAIAAPAVASAGTSRRSSRVAGEAGPAFPVSQRQGAVVDADASEDDVLVYLGKRDRGAWLKLRKQGKHDMADTLWLGKSLKALASRMAEAIIENLPVEAGQTATTDRTIEIWLRSFFASLFIEASFCISNASSRNSFLDFSIFKISL